jgi:hypothetical protein
LADTPPEPATFLDALDQFQHAGIEEVRLVGGEPLLHPDFLWMLRRVLERGFSVRVSTGGLIPYAVCKRLEQIPADQLTVLVHLATPGEASPAALERQSAAFMRLGARIQLAMKLQPPALIAPEVLLEPIARFGLKRRVWFGLLRPLEVNFRRQVAVLIQTLRTAGVLIEMERDGEREQ